MHSAENLRKFVKFFCNDPFPNDPISELLIFGLAKYFCRAKFWAKFAFWRGGVWAEVFGEVWGEVCGLVMLGHSGQKKPQQKLQPKSPTALGSKAGENSGENFMTRFCKGTPPIFGMSVIFTVADCKFREFLDR